MWEIGNDESRLFKEIKNNYNTIIARDDILDIESAYVCLKGIIKNDEETCNEIIYREKEDTSTYKEAFRHKKTSTYYQHINLNTLNRLWQASFSAYIMNELINGKRDDGWQAQQLGLYFLTFCSCSYGVIGLIDRECEICSGKKNSVKDEKGFLNLNNINKQIQNLSVIIQRVEGNKSFRHLKIEQKDISLMRELDFYRNEGEHHFFPSSTLFIIDNKWVIPKKPKRDDNKKSYAIPFEDIIVVGRDVAYRNNQDDFIVLRDWFVKIFELEVKLVKDAWIHLGSELKK